MATERTVVQRGPGLFVAEIYMPIWVPNNEVKVRGRQGGLQSLARGFSRLWDPAEDGVVLGGGGGSRALSLGAVGHAPGEWREMPVMQGWAVAELWGWESGDGTC